MTYFAAEKLSAAAFILLGAAALGFSAFLWKSESLYKGMVYPLVVIGFIQLVVGSTVFFRTEPQVAQLVAQLNATPMDFRSEELSRMNGIMNSFSLYKIIEIALLATGVSLTFLVKDNLTMLGVAVGLIAESSILLVADLIAEQRAAMYIMRLQEFIPIVS